jgi:hypothetical protein
MAQKVGQPGPKKQQACSPKWKSALLLLLFDHAGAAATFSVALFDLFRGTGFRFVFQIYGFLAAIFAHAFRLSFGGGSRGCG